MQLSINDAPRRLLPGSTVATLVDDRTRGVAVAVNGAVVPRSAWAVTTLHSGDRIELLEATQGG